MERSWDVDGGSEDAKREFAEGVARYCSMQEFAEDAAHSNVAEVERSGASSVEEEQTQ